MRTFLYFFIFVLGSIVVFQACKTYQFRNNYHNVNRLLHDADSISSKLYLKAHLKNGDVYVLDDNWKVDSADQTVYGYGTMYDFNRTYISEGEFNICIDSVAIFETNQKLNDTESKRVTALSVLAAVDFTIAIGCQVNPKACFGSCPTFYINQDDNFHYSDAEGFSNAIAPSMEYYDIDAIGAHQSDSGRFNITMKNEALETHCVNDVQLYAYPLKEHQRVFQTPNNKFYGTNEIVQLDRATAAEGDVTELLNKEDYLERFSLSDEQNLIAKEEIFLTFKEVPQNCDVGLALNFRQTLMTTYFIYSAMGYMGDEVGDIFARIETEPTINDELKNGIKKELGKVDVYVWDQRLKDWVYQNGFYETGPIAINNQIIPFNLSNDGGPVKVKLVLNKGLWRIDYAALSIISEEVKPVKLRPTAIFESGLIDERALDEINNPDDYLLSMPGDAFRFEFELPTEHDNYELFLYSKGYYLEWMRKKWIKDKDLFKLNQMVKHPIQYLKSEAKKYKHFEADMEYTFWNSKIDTETFSYDAN